MVDSQRFIDTLHFIIHYQGRIHQYTNP